MRDGRIRNSRWWLTILAFLAGIAVHAADGGHRSQVLIAQPSSVAVTPVAHEQEMPGRLANADTDTSDIQLD
jgi:hypothetical protein